MVHTVPLPLPTHGEPPPLAGIAVIGAATVLAVPTPDDSSVAVAAMQVADSAAFVAMAVALGGPVLARALGGSRIGRAGRAVAILALLGFAAVEFAQRWAGDLGEALHPVTVPLLAVGMTVLGWGVLRANRWTGWCRATPLYCGLTPILVELPVFVVLGPQPLAIAVTWVAWLPFGFALLVRSGRLSVTRTLN